MEFVGDVVVQLVAALVAAIVLWEYYPDCPVGDFAAMRSVLVCDRQKIGHKYFNYRSG